MSQSSGPAFLRLHLHVYIDLITGSSTTQPNQPKVIHPPGNDNLRHSSPIVNRVVHSGHFVVPRASRGHGWLCQQACRQARTAWTTGALGEHSAAPPPTWGWPRAPPSCSPFAPCTPAAHPCTQSVWQQMMQTLPSVASAGWHPLVNLTLTQPHSATSA